MATTLYLNDQPADLPERGTGLTLNYSIRNLRQFGGAMGNTSYTLKLPATSRNRRIFAHLDELTADLEFAYRAPDEAPRPDRLVQMQLFVDGELFMQGFARVLAFSERAYEIQLISGNADWGEQFKTRLLSDIDTHAAPSSWRYRRWQHTYDLCDYERTLTATGQFDPAFDEDSATTAEVHAAWQTHCYPPIAYNEFSLEDNLNTPFAFEHLRPATYIAPLLYAHFDQIGYRLESDWLLGLSKGEQEHPLCLPFVQEKFQERAGGEVSQLAQLSLSADDATVNRFRNMLPLDTIDDDTAGETGVLVYSSSTPAPNGHDGGNHPSWIPQRAGRYRISGRYIADGTPGNGQVTGLSVGLMNPSTGVVVTTFWSMVNANNPGIWDVLFDAEIEILPEWIGNGYGLVMYTAGAPNSTVNKAGSFVKIERLNQVFEGNTYDLRACFPEATVLELIKTLTLMFNLRFETDTQRRIVRMEPRDEFYTPNGADISPIVERDAPIEQSLLSANYPRTQTWGYANDRDDALIDDYQQRTQRAYASASLSNPSQTVTDTAEREARPFSATYTQLESSINLSVPQLMATPDEPEFRTDFAPRILYVRPLHIRQFDIENQLANTSCPGGSYSAGVHNFQLYQHAYFSGRRLSLRFDDEPGQNLGLLSRYYAAEWANLTQARLLNLRARPGVPSLQTLLKFRALQTFDGQPYALQSLSRVKPGQAQPFELSLERMDVRTQSVDFPFQQRYCVQFNGGSEYARLISPTGIFGAQYFTLSFWFRRLGGYGNTQTLVDERLTGGAGFFLQLNTSNQLRMFYNDGNADFGLTSIDSITDSDWHYVSFIRRWNSPSEWTVYFDGENLLTTSFGPTGLFAPAQQAADVRIGGDSTLGFIGQMARLHAQEALISLNEHAHRWNDGEGTTERDLKRTRLLLPFDQAFGEICIDEAVPPTRTSLLNKPLNSIIYGTDTWLPWRES